MELSDLVGEHVLDAVDESNELVNTYGDYFEHANVIRFRLDGICYTATEDPNDGYRSSMNEIFVSDGKDMKNVFPPVHVVGRHRTEAEYGGVDDVLELIDVEDGEVILEVGTSNTDDYYPSFVACFRPGKMNINKQG